MYQGIIFDFNGTMFFDSHENEKAWRDFILLLIGKEITDTEYHTYIHGQTNKPTLEHFLNRELSPKEVSFFTEQKEELYRKYCLEKGESFSLVPGLPDFLNSLVEKEFPRIIATGAGKSNIDFYLASFYLDQWFSPEHIIYDDGSFPGKPNPTIYIKAAERLSLPPEKCIVIEDSLAGIQAAESAGIGQIILISDEIDNPLSKHPSIKETIYDFYDFDLDL